jgi:homoserine acetyltransferase
MNKFFKIGAAAAMAASSLAANALTNVVIDGGPSGNAAFYYGSTAYEEGGATAARNLLTLSGANYSLTTASGTTSGFVRAVEYYAETSNAGSFAAYCIGINSPLDSNGALYTFTDTQKDAIGRLFKVTGFDGLQWKGDGVTTGLESTALQIAIWEVMSDPLSSYDLSAGNIKFTGLNGDVRTMANSFLQAASLLNTGTYSADVRIFNSFEVGASQPLVTTVPEPSTYAMLAACLGVMGLVTRRKSA